MKLDKSNKTKIESLTESEASVYICFLELERIRHAETAKMCETWVTLWLSEMARQIKELEGIDERLDKVKKRLGW